MPPLFPSIDSPGNFYKIPGYFRILSRYFLLRLVSIAFFPFVNPCDIFYLFLSFYACIRHYMKLFQNNMF